MNSVCSVFQSQHLSHPHRLQAFHHSFTMTRDLSLLEQLENSGVKVDVDSYHLSWIKAVPFTPHDVTSNQIVIQQQMLLPENKEIIERTVREMKDKDWLDIHTVLVSPPSYPV